MKLYDAARIIEYLKRISLSMIELEDGTGMKFLYREEGKQYQKSGAEYADFIDLSGVNLEQVLVEMGAEGLAPTFDGALEEITQAQAYEQQNTQSFRTMTGLKKQKALAGDVACQREWMAEEIHEYLFEQIAGNREGEAEEAWGLLRTASQFPATATMLIGSIAGKLLHTFETISLSQPLGLIASYNAFATYKHNKGQALDMSFGSVMDVLHTLYAVDNQVQTDVA